MVLTLLGAVGHEQAVANSHEVLQPFFVDYIHNQKVRTRVRQRYGLLLLLKDRLKQRFLAHHAGVNVLLSYWTRLTNQLKRIAGADRAALSLITELATVPEEIRIECFRSYSRQCKDLQGIAFLQWRRRHGLSIRHDDETFKKLISAKIKYLKGIYNDAQVVSQETSERAVLPGIDTLVRL